VNAQPQTLDTKDLLFGLFSLILLVLLGYAVWAEETAPWKRYQTTYYRMLAEETGDPALARSPIRVQQIWSKDLGRADRCTTCHLGVSNPAFANAEQPYRTHPFQDGWIGKHPFERFGCTVCHEGDGRETRYNKTHGYVKHLDYPSLTGPFIEASCTKCHRALYAPEIYFAQTPWLMRGKQLVGELGCGACHTIQQMGVSSTLAPDISELGSQTELAFKLVHDFAHVEGERTKRVWEWEHFKDPLKIVPGNPDQMVPPTFMPDFGLTDDETTALTVFVLSLRSPKAEPIPDALLPSPPGHDAFIQYATP